MSKLFWPTVLMPNLLAVRQSRNLFNFGQYKLYFSCLTYKICVQRKKCWEVAMQLCLCFSSNHIDPDGGCPEWNLLADCQQSVPVCLSNIKMKLCKHLMQKIKIFYFSDFLDFYFEQISITENLLTIRPSQWKSTTTRRGCKRRFLRNKL